MADTLAFYTAQGIIPATIDPHDFVATFMPRVTGGAPPVLEVISPAIGTTISRLAALVFRLSGTGWAIRDLWVGFGVAPNAFELAFDGTSFRGNYAAGSSEAGDVFELVRAGGWPVASRVLLRADVVDTNGNVVVITNA